MRPALCLSLLAGLALAPTRGLATEEGKPDPWTIPKPDLADLFLVLQESKRDYSIELATKVPNSARLPERVECQASDEEKVSLQSCRDLQKAGKWSEAAHALDGLLKVNPALHEARKLLGVSRLREKKHEEAVGALRDALIGNRRDPEAWKALEEAAAALEKKVLRPHLQPQSWLSPGKGDTVEVGIAEEGSKSVGLDETPAWAYYVFARAGYRYEGGFAADFPGEAYRYTFREVLHGVGAVLQASRRVRSEGGKLSDDLRRLLEEEKAGTVVPYAYFALYTEPLPAEPESGFDLLRPRLVKYFDEKVLIKK